MKSNKRPNYSSWVALKSSLGISYVIFAEDGHRIAEVAPSATEPQLWFASVLLEKMTDSKRAFAWTADPCREVFQSCGCWRTVELAKQAAEALL